MAEKRMAGDALNEYKDYLDNYDRTAKGAGSSKGTDRFSGLDVREAFDNRGDLSKAEGAQAVLDYFDGIKDTTKHGGATADALDVLRGYTKEKPVETPEVAPTPEPEVDPDPVIEPTPVAPPTVTAGDINIDTGADFGDQVFTGNGSGGPGQNVVQDNDQVSSVVGNDNTVNQDQDNSVRNYGARTFNPTDWKKEWMNSKFAA